MSRMQCVGILTAIACLGCGGVANAASSLRADYQLDGDRASDVERAPRIANLGVGNGFAIETSNGDRRGVVAFPRGGGLRVDAKQLVDRRNYSVAMLFRLAETAGYRRLIDLTNGTSDNGLYDFNGKAVIYVGGPVAASQRRVFDGSYAHVVLTSAAGRQGMQKTIVYVNGRRVAAAKAAQSFTLESGMVRFFKDNAKGIGAGEESAGAVDCILLYDGVLTARQARRVAHRGSRCSAARRRRRHPDALVTDSPRTRQSGPSIFVDSGLTVHCPGSAGPCTAAAHVDRLSSRGRNKGRLGATRLSVPAGSTTSLAIPLTEDAIATLRSATKLKIEVAASITGPSGKRATARRAGRIGMPRPFDFRPGTYVGTTSQGLPASLEVGQTAVHAFRFRWRALCADGQTHENDIFLNAPAPVQQGRFSYDAILNTGARAQVSGELSGTEASGTLSRSGGSAFNTDCVAKDIAWSAQFSGPIIADSP